MFRVFIKTIINFVRNPLESEEPLYSRKQLYFIILPTLALTLLITKIIVTLILENIFGVNFVASQYYFNPPYLEDLNQIFWLIIPIQAAVKESFIYFFLLSLNPRKFFTGAVFLLCFTIVEFWLNYSRQLNIEIFWYIFRYLMLALICIGSFNLFEKKLRRFFRKLTPYFPQTIIVSCLLYWVYSSIQFNPHQTPFLAILILNLRLIIASIIFCWVRMRYSFRQLLMFYTLTNIAYYANILVIIFNLYNIIRYNKEIISSGFACYKDILNRGNE